MRLVEVDIKKFKYIIYPEYVKLFPEVERKSYRRIRKAVKNKISKIIEIVADEQFVGFMIINTLENNPYVQLDYLAILPNHQNKGYGKEAIKLLKKQYENYNGIFIEVEKLGLGKNEEENRIREKRVSFYENLGFYKMNFDLELFTVIYSAYLLPGLEIENSDKEIINYILKIYTAILGKNKVKKNCKVMMLK